MNRLEAIRALLETALKGRYYLEDGFTWVANAKVPTLQLVLLEDGCDEPCWMGEFGYAPGQHEVGEVCVAALANLERLLLIANEARLLNDCVRDEAFGHMSKADIIRLLHVFLARTRDALAPLLEEDR